MKKIITFVLMAVMLFTFPLVAVHKKNELPQEYIGKWQANIVSSLMDGVKTYKTSTLELNKDGSATYQGKAFTWKYLAETQQIIITSKDTNQSASFEIEMIDGKQVIKFYEDVYYSEQDFIAKEKEYVDNNTSVTDNTHTQTNSKEVVITIDNWHEYFDVTEYPLWKENAFGEIDDLAIWWGISLKEEFYGLVDTDKEQSVAFELSGKYNNYGIQVDTNKKEYLYTELIYVDGEVSVNETVTYDFLGQYNCDTEDFNFLRIWSSGIGEADKDGKMIEAVYRYYDISVLRAEGKIYLLKQ